MVVIKEVSGTEEFNPRDEVLQSFSGGKD